MKKMMFILLFIMFLIGCGKADDKSNEIIIQNISTEIYNSEKISDTDTQASLEFTILCRIL